MANETIVDGKVTFRGDVAGIATFVRMNNSFLASHPKAKDKGVGYYTNLFTEDGRFLIDESEIAQYLKKSKTFSYLKKLWILQNLGENFVIVSVLTQEA